MKSRRLTFRELRESDAERIAYLAGDWDIARMTARIPYPYSEPQAHEWLRGIEPGEFVRAIELKGELIGAVGYMPASDGSAEIGYWIGRPWWGKGYATEAAQALIRYCFGPAGFSRLTCCHSIDNPASARVIAKLGFRRLGPAKAWCEARGAEIDTVLYERRRPVIARFWRRAA